MTSDKKALTIRLQEANAKKNRYQELLNKSSYKTGDAKKERTARTHALCKIGGVLAAFMNMPPADINADRLLDTLHRYKIKMPDRVVSLGEYIRIRYNELK